MSKFLRESTGSPKGGAAGKYLIKIIESDVHGSSGYYPREVIERDGPGAWPNGTKIYADHDLDLNESRPIRSVKDIAGKFVSDPFMREDGLYAEAQFAGPYAKIVEDFSDVIGMSIYAGGETRESEDESGNIVTTVESIAPSPLNSVDLVTTPGANGAIMEALSESFREAGNKPERKTEVDSKDIEAIAEAVSASLKPIADQIEALSEAVKPEEPKAPEEVDYAAVTEAAVEADLPKQARARVIESVKAGAKAEDAIAAEQDYMKSIRESVEAEVQGGVLHEGGDLDTKFANLSIFGSGK